MSSTCEEHPVLLLSSSSSSSSSCVEHIGGAGFDRRRGRATAPGVGDPTYCMNMFLPIPMAAALFACRGVGRSHSDGLQQPAPTPREILQQQFCDVILLFVRHERTNNQAYSAVPPPHYYNTYCERHEAYCCCGTKMGWHTAIRLKFKNGARREGIVINGQRTSRPARWAHAILNFFCRVKLSYVCSSSGDIRPSTTNAEGLRAYIRQS